MPVTFHTADIKFTLRGKKKIKEFIHSQVIQSSKYQTGTLSFVFCSDEYLRAINRQFLNHDYYTDIITFPLSENKKQIDLFINSIDIATFEFENIPFKTLHYVEKKIKVHQREHKVHFLQIYQKQIWLFVSSSHER